MAVNELKKDNLRTLKNGAIYDMDKKRIVANPGGGTTAITSENASALHAMRYEKAREAIREAVLAEVQGIADIPANTPEDAYAFVVAKQTVALLDSDKPRFDDVEKLGQLMGAVERKQAASAPVEAAADLVREVAALAAMVMQAGQAQRDIVDGTVQAAGAGEAEKDDGG